MGACESTHPDSGSSSLPGPRTTATNPRISLDAVRRLYIRYLAERPTLAHSFPFDEPARGNLPDLLGVLRLGGELGVDPVLGHFDLGVDASVLVQ
jgi:hypothetical protein